jgi:8-oxo-dGTP pyrophosphatase MutT (NUDIX family)
LVAPRDGIGKSAGELLAPFPVEAPYASEAGAAVMIFLRTDPGSGRVETLLMERAVRDGDPGSGQVGLPGGRVAPGDRTLRETALRESEEEVGLGLADLESVPRYVGTTRADAFGLTVGILAGALHASARRPHARDPEEVAEVFWLPGEALARSQRVERPTRHGPRSVDAAVQEGHVVWGFTRRILQEFFGHPIDAESLRNPHAPSTGHPVGRPRPGPAD